MPWSLIQVSEKKKKEFISWWGIFNKIKCYEKWQAIAFVLEGCKDDEQWELILGPVLFNILINVLEDTQGTVWIWFVADAKKWNTYRKDKLIPER